MSKLEVREKCGVFGIYHPDEDVARVTYFGLQALQHRGQESAGIVTSDAETLFSHKGMGLVSRVFREEHLRQLAGFMAVGHVRYATSGGSKVDHCQPVIDEKTNFVLAHNGNLPSTLALEEFLSERCIPSQGLNDSEMMTKAIGYYLSRGENLVDAIEDSKSLFNGAYSLVMMWKDRMAALRDRCGIRPLVIGRLSKGFVFASETCALDELGAIFEREVNPGELVVTDGIKLYSHQMESDRQVDAFEFVYFARPDSTINGKLVYSVREKAGMILAREYPVDADLVVPIPDSGIPGSIGFARQSGITYQQAVHRSEFVDRTFIQPDQSLREMSVRMKLRPMAQLLKGRDIVVVDDSIVRGTTMRDNIQRLREAGVKRVHVRVVSPPVRYPDFYGIDTPDQRKLIAFGRTVEEISGFIGADSLGYLSLDGLKEAIGLPPDQLCTSCFTGVYPITIGERAASVMMQFV